MQQLNPANSSASSVPFAFFGTPYVARDTLAALLDGGFTPAVVVTSPDAQRGRGMQEQPCATKEYALDHNLPVLTPSSLDESFLTELTSYGCRYAIVVAYGKIMPQVVIDAFPLGVLNVHYSLLPVYRGASPVEAALLAGDLETGVTIQRMVFKMDAGDILAQERIAIDESETIRGLRPKLITLGSDLLIRILPDFISGSATYTLQDESKATFARKIPKEAGRLSLSDPDETNWRKYRAFLESPGTYFFAQKEGKRIRVKITGARYEDGRFIIERITPEGKSEQPFAWVAQNGWAPE